MLKKVAIIAPTPAPYRAYEYDTVQRALAVAYEFHAFFMEPAWGGVNWNNPMPKVMAWEILPKSSLSSLLRNVPGFRRFNKGVTKRLKALDPAAVILHGYDAPALWAGYFWAKRNKRAVLFRSDSNIAKEQNRSVGYIRASIKRFILKYLLERIDGFLTIGTANENYYKLYGATPDKFFRSAYLTDSTLFADGADRQRKMLKPLKVELGIDNKKVLLFVGRFIWEKNLEKLLLAFRLVLKSCDNVVLLLVGNGPQKDEIKRMSDDIRDNVRLIDFQQPEGVSQLYGIANLLVLPSIQEAWGLVVNEAMAAGLPVVVSDRVGAAYDLVLPGVTGAISPAGDAVELATAISKMLNDENVAAEMGRRGQERLKMWNKQYDVVDGYRKALEAGINRAK